MDEILINEVFSKLENAELQLQSKLDSIIATAHLPNCHISIWSNSWNIFVHAINYIHNYRPFKFQCTKFIVEFTRIHTEMIELSSPCDFDDEIK